MQMEMDTGRGRIIQWGRERDREILRNKEKLTQRKRDTRETERGPYGDLMRDSRETETDQETERH